MSKGKRQNGFTFVEVLVAMVIFVMSVVAAVDLIRGAVTATSRSKNITVATWLLQNAMVELETKVETRGFEEGCEEKNEAKFPEPYEDYRWVSYCTQIDFKLSETASQMAKQLDPDADEEGVQEDPLMKQMLTLASQYMSNASRELHTEVLWMDGKVERSISLTTHVVRYDLPFQLPGFGGSGGSSSGEEGGSTETSTDTSTSTDSSTGGTSS